MRIIARFLVLLKPHYRLGIGIFLITLLSTFVTVGTPFLYRELVDNGIQKGNVPYLFRVLLLILLAMVLQEVFYLGQTSLILKIRKLFFTRLRMDVYQHLLRMPQRFYADNHRGRLLSRLTSDVDAVQNLLLEKYVYFVHNLLVGLSIFAIIFTINGQMILLAASVIPFIYVLYLLYKNKIQVLSRRVQEKREDMMERLTEDLSMVKVIQSFSVLEDRMSRTHNVMQDTEELKKRLSMRYSVASSSTTIINLVGLCAIWGLGGTAVSRGTMTMGTLIAISFYLNYVVNLFFSAYYTAMGFQNSIPAAERIFEVLDYSAAIADSPDAVDVSDFGGSVEFRNVTFSYKKKPVFSGVNFRLQKGDIVGIVGESGQGKTTLANLFLRFYDPKEGTIELNGLDIRRIKLERLRSKAAIVPQEDYLFNMSIRDNIRMGRNGISEDQFLHACRLAKVDAFAEAFSEGYDTPIGENGARLSSGQRKRLSIARALLDDPYILIFDEATSVLDERNEREILDSFRGLAENRIVLIITHKLSNLQFASGILHLQDGKVERYGSYADFAGAEASSKKQEQPHQLGIIVD